MQLLQRLCYSPDKADKIFKSGIVDAIISVTTNKKFPGNVLAEWFALVTKLTNSEDVSKYLVQDKNICPDIIKAIYRYMKLRKSFVVKLLSMGAMTFGNFCAVFTNAEFLK